MPQARLSLGLFAFLILEFATRPNPDYSSGFRHEGSNSKEIRSLGMEA